MNITDQQKDLLRKIVEVYINGCHSPFIFNETLSGVSLVYAGHPIVPVDAALTDLKRLQAEQLIDCEFTDRSTRGKPTASGIVMVQRNFEEEAPAVLSLRMDSVLKTRFYNLINSDFATEKAVHKLIATMFHETEAEFYYFEPANVPMNGFIKAALDRRDLIANRYDKLYYAHPKGDRDFLQIIGAQTGKYASEWQRTVVEKGPEYVRRPLKLSDRKHRELETLERIHIEIMYREQLKRERNSFDTFLSYAAADQLEAEKIYEAIVSAGGTAFLAKKSLRPGEDFAERIREALHSSRELWLLVSPSSLKSEWVMSEWGAAWVLQKDIVPILHRCKPEDLPSRLAKLQVIDFYQYAELVQQRIMKQPL